MTPRMFYTLARVLAALTVIPFHEAGHALAAWLLGDPTAKQQGRLSLNPFRHFDLLGTLCMVFAGVGWAKPVSTNPRNFKNPKWGMALTALAGPAANLLLAYLGMVAWKILYYWAPTTMITIFAARFLQYLVMMDVGLAVFNLIPIPPLDGSRILLAAVWAGVLDGVLGTFNDVVWDLLDLGTGYIDQIAYSAYYAAIGTVI